MALEITFKICLQNGRFLLERKKANIAPVHKKHDKQTIENYRLERLPYVNLFNFFLRIIYFLHINLDLDQRIVSSISFDTGLDVRGIFLDISKAFDKVWHDGLILKLRQNSICGEIINIFEEFLSNRKQIVVLNGQCLS